MQGLTMADGQLRRATTAAPKKLDVGDFLVWVYRDQCADRVYDAGLEDLEAAADGRPRASRSGDGCCVVERLALYGCQVDQSGRGAGALDPDAELAHEVVMGLEPSTRWLVIRSARVGTPPDWYPDAESKWEPVWRNDPAWSADGRPVPGSYRMIYDRNRNPVGCAVELVGDDPTWINAMRAQYVLWHRGVSVVAAYFRRNPGALRRHRLTGFAAPPRPWKRKG